MLTFENLHCNAQSALKVLVSYCDWLASSEFLKTVLKVEVSYCFIEYSFLEVLPVLNEP